MTRFIQVDVPTYNPEDHCKTMPVMTTKTGAKPSERKYHRNEERERFRKFASGPLPAACIASGSRVSFLLSIFTKYKTSQVKNIIKIQNL